MISKVLVRQKCRDFGRCGDGERMMEGGGGIICYDEEVG